MPSPFLLIVASGSLAGFCGCEVVPRQPSVPSLVPPTRSVDSIGVLDVDKYLELEFKPQIMVVNHFLFHRTVCPKAFCDQEKKSRVT